MGDVVLLERKRENKLSPSYESQPYEVAARYGDPVVLKTPQGVEHTRNLREIRDELAADAEGSTESGGDTLEPARRPELTD